MTGLEDLRLSESYKALNGFPMIPPGASNGIWRATHLRSATPKAYAIDCEMVLTTNGDEVGRVSMVDWNEFTIIDLYVKPMGEVLDYRTAHSGLIKEHLEHSFYDIRGVQSIITDYILSADDFLIGHAIQNDLKVLKLNHSKIIDSQAVWRLALGKKGRPSLKKLAKKFFHKEIQQGSHNSVEDAITSLKLVKHALETLPMETVEARLRYN